MKYPRTYHLPYSLGISSDDKVLKSDEIFKDQIVLITEKLDGENTTLTNQKIYARSLDSKDHPSRHFVKGIWGKIKNDIPVNFRICGENLFAKHSIFYENLKSYFYCFNIWNNTTCLSVDETLEYCYLLDLEFVPILYKGIYNIDKINEIISNLNFNNQEGFVIRNVNQFEYSEFGNNVAKFVRPNHVTTSGHWMYTKIIKNKLL